MASSLRSKKQIDSNISNKSGQFVLKPSNLDAIQSTDMENNSSTFEQNSTSPVSNNYDESAQVMETTNQPCDLKMTASSNSASNNQDSSRLSNLQQLKSSYDILNEEIEDFMDENPTNDTIVSVEDIDSCISKITDLRSQYRKTVKSIQLLVSSDQFEASFSHEITASLACIKEYIINANDRKSQIRQREKNISDSNSTIKLKRDAEENSQRKRATDFLISEVTRITNELLIEFEKECDGQVTDDEISRRKEDLPANLLKMDQLSIKFQKCLETIPDDYEDKEIHIHSMTNQYNDLIQHKDSYEAFLQNEILEREISKEKTFQIASLNIKLTKFSGYDSEMDIYTFQCEFDKLHLKSTPKKMLSDLLKYNYLEDPALSLVKSLDNIDEMWLRLKKAYGDPKTLLHKKLSTVENIGPLWKIKDVEKLKMALMSLINGMTDLMALAKYHNIEGKLYYGDGIDTIYAMMGDFRVTKWLTQTCDLNLEGKELWSELIQFLEKELKVKQELFIIKKKYTNEKSERNQASYCTSNDANTDESDQDCNSSVHVAVGNQNTGSTKCKFCNESGHYERTDAHGNKVIDYFSCEKFVQMTPLDRFKELRRLGYCYMCLYPGAKQNIGKHASGTCQSEFICRHSSHDPYNKKKHVLVCQEHNQNEENKKTLETFKERFILSRPGIPEFSKNIKLSFLSQQTFISELSNQSKSNDDSIIVENGIYLLQKIQVDGQEYTIFFDSGCSDMVAKHDALVRLGNRAHQEIKGPISLGGVGNLKTESKQGVYQIRLPLTNGKDAVLAGVSLDKITNTFPQYPLNGQIKADITRAFEASGEAIDQLPKLPDTIGGDIDFMIGTKYLRYHPVPVFTLKTGLTIYKSPFLGVNGNQGVVGGPHHVITEVDKAQNKSKMCQYAYFTDDYRLLQHRSCENIESSSAFEFQKNLKQNYIQNLVCWEDHTKHVVECTCCLSLTLKAQKHFEEAENAASEILYRCVNCRKCQNCRNGERIEYVSVREEVEQDIINHSVSLDIEKGTSIATLPVIENPITKLAPNKSKALAMYKSQIRRLAKDPKSKEEVLASENKLQNLGHVDYVKNLSRAQQLKLKENPIQNYIPWSAVWKENSISTPCRIVFNASLPTESKLSLNDILAKGTNNMNALVEIFIRWRTYISAFHTDVQKMYNSVKLEENDWCLQRYIWQENLDPQCIPEEKVIKTLIYGVKSSGNQAERALRLTAEYFKSKYEAVHDIIKNDTYVDDCLSGQNCTEDSFQRADELDLILMHGGFHLKGFTFSGFDPLKALSEDGESIGVAGMKWYPKKDLISLDINPLCFSKRVRGQQQNSTSEIPNCLTRRQCVSKVAEIFDLTGMITPLTAAMKLDLHDLVQRKLDWDDRIPDDLRPVWLSNFDMINELKTVRFRRAVVPTAAVSMDINTLDFSDASKSMACVAIYARFLLKCGSYSCQLIFARSKLIPEGMTIPRAELLAANLNAHTGEVVKRALSKFNISSQKFTDSQVTMHWLNNQELQLKQWTRNRVVEILRFTDAPCWKYVPTSQMPADIGTRRVSNVNDVIMGSIWQEGFPWMKLPASDFPVKSYSEIKHACKEASDSSNELIPQANLRNGSLSEKLSFHSIQEDKSRSNDTAKYLIDPNKFRFQKVVRILALVIIFIKRCKTKSSYPKSICLKIPDEEIKEARNYFFRIATKEVKSMMSKDKYEKISVEKDNILYYSGRILPTQQFSATVKLTDTMLDLTTTTFCVPLVMRSSAIALSIVNEVHWFHEIAKHAGVETVLRYVMQHAYIVEGRDLVRYVRKHCIRCKLILKRTLNVSMGPVSPHQLKIAPAFYATQTDIAGPFNAYSLHNKRTTIKVWMIVFCCTATTTTSIKIMEDYGTTAFLQAFIRFSCDVGYPKVLLIDEGSQLIKGCEAMKFKLEDAQRKLHIDQQVDFEICPVGGHNFHGKVERKIRTIKESIEKSTHKERLSVLQWETLGAQIANAINNLPIAMTKTVSDLENADLITPNRLKLGRNNDRSPVGTLSVTSDPQKIIKSNEVIFNSWFESWLVSYVPKLMYHPKWFVNDADLKKGDIVLFLKNDKELCDTYQYGMIDEANPGIDGKLRSVNVRYRNSSENVDRYTTRAVRQLVKIHSTEDIDHLEEINGAANFADTKFICHASISLCSGSV